MIYTSSEGYPLIVNNSSCPILGESDILSSNSFTTSSFEHTYNSKEEFFIYSAHILIELGEYVIPTTAWTHITTFFLIILLLMGTG